MRRRQEDVPEAAALKEPRPTLAEIKSWPATVNVPQAALALGISPRTLYYLIKRGEAPVKVLPFGTRSVVTTQSLVTLLESA